MFTLESLISISVISYSFVDYLLVKKIYYILNTSIIEDYFNLSLLLDIIIKDILLSLFKLIIC